MTLTSGFILCMLALVSTLYVLIRKNGDDPMAALFIAAMMVGLIDVFLFCVGIGSLISTIEMVR
jgi:hypothetical protein